MNKDNVQENTENKPQQDDTTVKQTTNDPNKPQQGKINTPGNNTNPSIELDDANPRDDD